MCVYVCVCVSDVCVSDECICVCKWCVCMCKWCVCKWCVYVCKWCVCKWCVFMCVSDVCVSDVCLCVCVSDVCVCVCVSDVRVCVCVCKWSTLRNSHKNVPNCKTMTDRVAPVGHTHSVQPRYCTTARTPSRAFFTSLVHRITLWFLRCCRRWAWGTAVAMAIADVNVCSWFSAGSTMLAQ